MTTDPVSILALRDLNFPETAETLRGFRAYQSNLMPTQHLAIAAAILKLFSLLFPKLFPDT